MISKELLSKVLDNEVPYQVKVHKIIIKNNSLNYFYNSKDSGGGLFEANEYINIYELAHKCKEWAYIQGYVIFSKIRLNSSYASCYFDIIGKHDYEDDYHNDFRAECEPEAIFKACQWILDRNSK